MIIPPAFPTRILAFAPAVCALALAHANAATTQGFGTLMVGGELTLSDVVLTGSEALPPGVSTRIEGAAGGDGILGSEAWVSTLSDGVMRSAAQSFVMNSFAKSDPATVIHFLSMMESRERGIKGWRLGESWTSDGESSERIERILSRWENRRSRGEDADAALSDPVPQWYGDYICSCSVNSGGSTDFPITVIPEPSVALLGAVGCVLLLHRRRTGFVP